MSTLESRRYTRSQRCEGIFDPVFQDLQNLNFFPPFTPRRRARSKPPSSSPVFPQTSIFQALTLHGVTFPFVINPTSLNIVLPMAGNNPWGPAVGPLALGANLHSLPKGSREHLPKFNGDGRVTVDEHLNAFNVACGVLAVQHEDVAIRLFVQTLTEGAADWFYHLPNGVITNWQDLKTRFEARFKVAEDDHSLIAQLAQLKKEIPESMRDFVAKFDKIVHKIPANRRPSDDNLKCFFINAMPAEISFFIRRERVQDLAAAKTFVVELEDDLINAGKWKREAQTTIS